MLPLSQNALADKISLSQNALAGKVPRIISFSGKKHCGKTELTKICELYGYETINFADELKNLVCYCLNISREDLEKKKDLIVLNPYELFKYNEYISEQTNIDIHIIRAILMDKYFFSIREILQFLGTDVIRKYNPMWHIMKVKNIITQNPDKLYCIGDTRFPDEKALIDYLGGESWYIIRGNYIDTSNITHISENSLTIYHFKNIIKNNGSKDDFIENFSKILSSRIINEAP